jgi:divalent metal cation (Fe/Co/Zn/Cd) transporter
VGVFTGSLGLIAEAAHSLCLTSSQTLITLLLIRVAAILPDRDHPYGHEKAEHLGALAGMALLAATAFFILYHAINKICVHPIRSEPGLGFPLSFYRSRKPRPWRPAVLDEAPPRRGDENLARRSQYERPRP